VIELNTSALGGGVVVEIQGIGKTPYLVVFDIPCILLHNCDNENFKTHTCRWCHRDLIEKEI
jgi:hypothetical protein